MIHLPPCAICQASDVNQGRYEGSVILWFTCGHCGHIWCAPNPQPSDVLSRGMTEFAWRRLHGHDIVAEARIDGCGLWSAATSRQSNPTVIVRTAKQLHSWDAACAKADALARQAFAHTCLATCGDWFAVLDDVRGESERLCFGTRLPRDHTNERPLLLPRLKQ